jgi:predicted transcriptional regulator
MYIMARLRKGESTDRQARVQRLLRRLRFGAWEAEIAEELGWQRRTVNNYLRKLRQQGKAVREGRSWFAKS